MEGCGCVRTRWLNRKCGEKDTGLALDIRLIIKKTIEIQISQ